ncbi:universal stress protein [Shinella yambaruensis]|uniref:Universal stress protein n=1 Tax=Shinella yambaruensis TaxID=415996 RepID=A0ABQ5ZSY7_9HYPH|nr:MULTISPECIES: universal stress protein [Shinella]CAI0335032.1 Universal stress protein [Rhizobiaceae bacterium]CAK7260448.1 Universal stress protein [Shinella sp. WSC3-e]MCJ8029601.1 universal stress protein [Shinella yambaruensis]MCO5139679.1 universal stress protein [Shinella sp.]MCU7983877.1 universal stress protein [Shinella yambaruensis]
MPFKTILSLIGTTDTEADIDKAVALTAELEGHLSVLALRTAISPFGTSYPAAAAWLDARQKEIDGLMDVRRMAEDRCRKGGLSFGIDHLYDDRYMIESNIGMRAMYADVVVAGEGIRSDADLRSAAVAATAFHSGTPLLLMPKAGRVSLKPKNVLLAWNGRPQAASAAKAAMEMLVGADAVRLVVIDPDTSYFGNGEEPGADMAAFLARHGAKVVVEQRSSGEREAEDVIRQHALELGCDMIVMGAYGHSRLRERIFGGVTASILESCDVPVFMVR